MYNTVEAPPQSVVSRLMCDLLQTCCDHFSLLSLAFSLFPLLLCVRLQFCCDSHGWKTFLVKSIQWFHAHNIPPQTAGNCPNVV